MLLSLSLIHILDCDRIRFFAVGIRVRRSGLLGPGIKLMQRSPLGSDQRLMERLVLCFIEGAVQVCLLYTSRCV